MFDIRRVPSTASISAYLGEIARFCEAQLGVRPELPAALVKALERDAAAHPSCKAKEPAPAGFVAAFLQDETIPLVLRTAAALLWHGTLRGADILSTRVSAPTELYVRREDVTFAPDLSYARLCLRKGKPLRKNQPNLRVIVAPGDNEAWAIDPVAMLLDYMRSTAVDPPHHPLLRHVDKHLATKAQLREAIKRKAASMGLDPTVFGCHSLRSGGDTTMRAHEVTDADIHLQGGWLSAGGDCPYRRRNVAQARRAQGSLRLPAKGHALPATLHVDMVTASSPLLPAAEALALLPR